MHHAVSHFWHRVPLIARLVGAVLLTVALVASVRTGLLAQEAKSFAQARLAEELAVVQAVVPAELIEELQRGNRGVVERFLQQQMDARPDLFELSWRAPDGTRITATPRPPNMPQPGSSRA